MLINYYYNAGLLWSWRRCIVLSCSHYDIVISGRSVSEDNNMFSNNMSSNRRPESTLTPADVVRLHTLHYVCVNVSQCLFFYFFCNYYLGYRSNPHLTKQADRSERGRWSVEMREVSALTEGLDECKQCNVTVLSVEL